MHEVIESEGFLREDQLKSESGIHTHLKAEPITPVCIDPYLQLYLIIDRIDLPAFMRAYLYHPPCVDGGRRLHTKEKVCYSLNELSSQSRRLLRRTNGLLIRWIEQYLPNINTSLSTAHKSVINATPVNSVAQGAFFMSINSSTLPARGGGTCER